MTKTTKLNRLIWSSLLLGLTGLLGIEFVQAHQSPRRAGLADNTSVDALLYGILQSDAAQVQRALAARIDPNGRDKFGQTVLIHIARWKHPEAARTTQLLVDRGADVNAAGPSHTPLINAIACDNHEVATVLLRGGAGPSLKACTPVAREYAINAGASPELVKLMLDGGGDASGLAMHVLDERPVPCPAK